jgi:sucrose-6-phosphate hydrolase SacC (GH32 family)
VVRTANGRNRERLEWHAWDVRELRGEKAELQIVDRHSGGWGHINVDHILLADQPARSAVEETNWADFGPDFYAAVSWNDVPTSDGRRVWLGWMSNWAYANNVPTSPWRGAMTVPRQLLLGQTADGLRLLQTPVAELESLRISAHRFAGGLVEQANRWLQTENLRSGPLELRLTLEAGRGRAGVNLFASQDQATLVAVDPEAGVVLVDRTRSGRTDFHADFPSVCTAPLSDRQAPVTLRILVDTSSVEVFVNNGWPVLTSLIFPDPEGSGIEFVGSEGTKFSDVQLWRLKSAWPDGEYDR